MLFSGAWLIAGIGYGLLTNLGEFIRRPLHAIGSYALGGLDFSLSMIANPLQGKDAPFVKHYPGGAVIQNSYIANNIVGSYSLAGVAYLESGDSRQAILHERGHNRTTHFDVWNILPGFKKREFDADMKAGTANYDQPKFLIYLFLSQSNPTLYEAIRNYNIYMNPGSLEIQAWWLIETIGRGLSI